MFEHWLHRGDYMGVSLTMIATVSEKFSKLINKNEYEPLLLRLMNASQIIFPSQYEWITSQSSSECDFVDVKDGRKYDAKLPFMRKHGKLIGSRNHDFRKWMELMHQEEGEFGEDIIATRGKNTASLEIYKIMEERLDTVECDENAIIFFPYPIVLDGKDMPFMRCVTDLLGAVFRELKKQNKVGTRELFVIYPAIDGDIVLRCLNTNKREYIRFPEFDKLVSYRFEQVSSCD